MIIKEKEPPIEPTPARETDSKLEFLKHMTEVQSKIKDAVSSDFILAKLGEQDKEGITEMTVNAYYGKTLMELLKKKCQKVWKWQKEGYWKKEDEQPEKLEVLDKQAQILFNTFMTRVYMTTILNRNVKDNYLIKLTTGTKEEEKEEEEQTETKETIRKLKKMAINKEEDK